MSVHWILQTAIVPGDAVLVNGTSDSSTVYGVVLRAIDDENLEIQLNTKEDFIHPLQFSGERAVVNVRQCSLATRNLLTEHQRQSAFGIPGITYKGRPWYSRVVHSEFLIDASVGSCVTGAASTCWWCLGFTETGQKRYPVAILLYDPLEKGQVIEIKLMNGTGLTVIPPSPTMDSSSLRSAYAALQSATTVCKPQRLRSQEPSPSPRSGKARLRHVSREVGRGQVPSLRGRNSRGRTSRSPPQLQPHHVPSRVPRSEIVVVSDQGETSPLPKRRARSPSKSLISKAAEKNVPETTTLGRPRDLQATPVSAPTSHHPIIDHRTFGALACVEVEPKSSAPLRPQREVLRPQEVHAHDFRSYLFEALVDAEELATRQSMEMRHVFDRQMRRADAMSKFDRFFTGR
jgi:hypothetical protein